MWAWPMVAVAVALVAYFANQLVVFVVVVVVLDMVLGHAADKTNTCHMVQADPNAVGPLQWASSEAYQLAV